jgi:hypothetical protein
MASGYPLRRLKVGEVDIFSLLVRFLWFAMLPEHLILKHVLL